VSTSSDDGAGDLQRATALCDIERFTEAVTLLTRLLASEIDGYGTRCTLARAQIGLGEYRAAVNSAAAAAALEPEREWPHRLMSIAYSRLRQHPEAIRQARESVRLAPQTWQDHLQLAQALHSAGDNGTGARSAAERARQLGPLEASTHLIVGNVAATAGRREEAEAAFRTALEIDPTNSAAHNELARLHLPRHGVANASGLGAAAAGFAAALRANPSGEISRRNLDAVLRIFIRRTAYFVLLDAVIASQVFADSSALATRLLPVDLLGIPIAFAWRFLGHLTKDLRRYLYRELLRPRLRIATAAEACAVCLVLYGPFAPERTRLTIGVLAALAALVARFAPIRLDG
jgi:tetratricopeptide (TPR) repeat protein